MIKLLHFIITPIVLLLRHRVNGLSLLSLLLYIYNQFRHSVNNIHVLRPLKMHRETFIFCLTLFIHKSELIPFLTKDSFKTLHQNLMLSTYR